MAGKVLAAAKVAEKLKGLKGWKSDGDALVRQLIFKDFRQAVAFLVVIAFDAEEADHHPDVTISYKRVSLSLSTHSEGGITEKDFALAKKISEAFAKRRQS